jgi:thioredoxin-related protein
MKKLLTLLFIICALVLVSFSPSGQTNVSFYSGTLADMKAKALIDNKPFFLNFYTDWCAPCRNMERYTFTDPELATFVEGNYFAFGVDAEGLTGDGIEVAQRYNVVSYPTIIIFSSKGTVLQTLHGYQSGKTLLKELQDYRFRSRTEESDIEEFSGPPVIDLTGGTSTAKPTATPPKPVEIDLTPKPTAPATPAPVFTPATPIATTSNLPGPDKPANRPSTTLPPPPSSKPATVANPGQGLFRMQVKPQASVGFGVQLGVFGDYANVIKEIQKLEGQGRTNSLVNINQLDGKTVFKVMLGPYPTRESASAEKMVLLTKENRAGMVVDLSGF